MLPIVGMSPGNSYFKDKEVAYLMRETLRKYGKAVVMVADVPAVSTYLAMGYTPSKAKSKARLKGNSLKNRTSRVLDEMGIDSSMVTIIDWANEVETSKFYIQSLIEVKDLYANNSAFHKIVFETSGSVLHGSKVDITDENIEQATEYLLAELAFIQASVDILGVNEVCYVYHNTWEVYEQRIAGKYDGKVRENLNFRLLEHPSETVLSPMRSVFKDRRESVQKRGSVRAILFPYLDQVYYDEELKERKGWCVEMVREIFRDHEINLEIVGEVGYGMVSHVFDIGEADIFISPIWPYDSRKLEVFHTASYATANIFGLVSLTSDLANISFTDIMRQKNLRVAVKENDIHDFLADQLLPLAKKVYVPQLSPIEEVVKKVLYDHADITFWDHSLISHIADLPGDDVFIKKSIVRNSPIVITDICFALPWGEFALKKVIDEGMKKYIDTFYNTN